MLSPDSTLFLPMAPSRAPALHVTAAAPHVARSLAASYATSSVTPAKPRQPSVTTVVKTSSAPTTWSTATSATKHATIADQTPS